MSTKDNAFWHPMLHPNEMKQREPIRIVRGEGCYVFDDKGNRLVDGVAGLWNVNVGHGRKEIKAAISAQLDELEYFQLFDGISHPRAEELAARVIGMLEPEGMRRVAFSSGGSDAIETALKLARQYWKLQGQADRTKFISLRQGYHGTHFGGASINGNTVFRRNYEPLLPGCFHIDTPWLYRNPYSQDPEELGQICADLLEREIQFQSPDTVAAFIAEPIQGAGGVIVPPANYWPLIRKVCDKYGVLLIADEIVTGFGRSGSLFGSRLWGVKPDIMCLAKGISSGYIPLGATTVNERIEQAFAANGNFTGAIMHGYTYSGHPVACAAALANLDIVEQENLPANAAKQGEHLLKSLASFPERFAAVGEVRGKGLMVALDLVSDKATREPIDPLGGYANRVAEIARANGVMVRPVGTKIILSPPLVIEREQIDTLVNALAIGFQEARY
ncbi:aspartate aminotransferase family protein [Metapseudomonas furukawaii]|uniref:Adenosylmethionine-8-amino-7-oxononanoate aminotransferase n=2 Tax=Metapseudomonas furukawaii TaxID=1149133 RepID=A0AAD1FG79_METFU|nr:aspartate aminotransferase family protein [Pseudomonas furukawaii]ELS25066.1 Adenosylmethionine-8-amino-7-oxononanoate aminotransferase [Pseudomonas furukawaii]BAU74877.1 adenosylmethionine-8-amino-7-oxononanoate aminotransferase [Pseudomonas furukawaii]